MRTVVLTVAVALSLGLLVLPAAVPGTSVLSPTQDAAAGRCIIGSDPGCITYCLYRPYACGDPP